MTEIENLSMVQTDRIISAGIELLAAISDGYGPTKGQKLWSDISDILGTDVRDAIFMALLTGRQSGVVIIRAHNGYRNTTNAKYVEFIKYIRAATGLGLKEAKDLADAVDSGLDKTVEVMYSKRTEFVTNLRSIGITAL